MIRTGNRAGDDTMEADGLPLVLLSASPHVSREQIPHGTAKRRELCLFLQRNQAVFRRQFQFLATRGLYNWINGGYRSDSNEIQNRQAVAAYEAIRRWHLRPTTYGGQEGGEVELANEVVANRSKVVLFFIDNSDHTGIHSAANQALARLCNFMEVPIYFNSTAAWFLAESLRILAVRPENYAATPDVTAGRAGKLAHTIPRVIPERLDAGDATAAAKFGPDTPIEERTLALISHDDQKTAMNSFVFFFQSTLARFKRIIATGTTGTRILELVPALEQRLLRYESGPKGGDIRIAFEILAGTCHDVVFFMDPLWAPPHSADIRVLTMACNQVGANIITNQNAAKDWIHLLNQTQQRHARHRRPAPRAGR